MTTRYLVGDVFDRLAEIPDGSVDLVVTSPPFLALRSYLPADHPLKAQEIGTEATPAAFIDVMLAVTAELRRVLAPHGSIAVELGDTYAGSGGAGGDYDPGGWREGQAQFAGSGDSMRESNAAYWRQKNQRPVKASPDQRSHRNMGEGTVDITGGPGWPLAKSRTMIPQLYEVALAYGLNPLTGAPSPAGRWRVRNVVTWCRPNPPVGALGDKWRPATSDVVVACVSDKRYWDDLATRTEHVMGDYAPKMGPKHLSEPGRHPGEVAGRPLTPHPSGAPLLDYWVIPPKGYSGAHYAVYPQELVVPLVKAMCPVKVCLTCGEPSRRITETTYEDDPNRPGARGGVGGGRSDLTGTNDRGINDPTNRQMSRVDTTLGWTDCGHDNWRTGVTLDPFAGSGTTLAVAQGHGRDSVGVDLDSRNAELAQGRLGMFLEVEE